MIDKNVHIWELFAGVFLLVIHVWAERERETSCLPFYLSLWFLGDRRTGGYHSLRSVLSWEEDQFEVLDKLNRDTLRYLIVTIYRDVELESNKQGTEWWSLAP